MQSQQLYQCRFQTLLTSIRVNLFAHYLYSTNLVISSNQYCEQLLSDLGALKASYVYLTPFVHYSCPETYQDSSVVLFTEFLFCLWCLVYQTTFFSVKDPAIILAHPIFIPNFIIIVFLCLIHRVYFFIFLSQLKCGAHCLEIEAECKYW